MTKWPVQTTYNSTKHTEQQGVTYIKNKLFVLFHISRLSAQLALKNVINIL